MGTRVPWRRFAFFEKEGISDDLTFLLEGMETTCGLGTDNGCLALGDVLGGVNIVAIERANDTAQFTNKIGTNKKLTEAISPYLLVRYDVFSSTNNGSCINICRAKNGFANIIDQASDTKDQQNNDDREQQNNQAQPELFFALGTESDGYGSIIAVKIWIHNPEKFNKKNQGDPQNSVHPVFLHQIDILDECKIALKNKNLTPSDLGDVTAFSVLHNGKAFSVGFKSGIVLLFQGDFIKKASKMKACHVWDVQDLIYGKSTSNNEDKDNNASNTRRLKSGTAVTALHFIDKIDPNQMDITPGGRIVRLFVVIEDTEEGKSLNNDYSMENYGVPKTNTGTNLESRIIAYDVLHPQAQPFILDDRGSAVNCSSIEPHNQELVSGRNDGIYFFSSEVRGGAVAFEVKQCLACLPGSMILVASTDERSQRTVLNMYDLRNKFVAFHLLLPNDHKVQSVFICENRNIDSLIEDSTTFAYVLTNQNTLFCLREKDPSSKLELLYRKNLYKEAISLAYSSNYEISAIMDIYRMYGDHLYKKGDYDGAIEQYCYTIGYKEPSYVIRRFLDAQRINNLTHYLDTLHKEGHATADLTTFLLNCYTKLKDVEKLDEFINNGGSTNGGILSPGGPTEEENLEELEELETAEGTVNTASSRRRNLMKKKQKINSNNNNNNNNQMGANFDIETAIRVLKTAGYWDHALELARRYEAHEWYLRIQLEKFTGNQIEALQDALQYIANLEFELAETYIKTYGKKLLTYLAEETTGLLMKLCTGRYKPTTATTPNRKDNDNINSKILKSKPEDFIHLFVDHPRWLRTFLEYVLKEESSVSTPVVNTLLELLLQEWESSSVLSPNNKLEREKLRLKKERDVMSLLDNPNAKYDEDHALVLVQMHNFKPGQLYLFEKLRMTDLVIEHYITEKDTESIMRRICRKENRKNPDLWIKVLTYVITNAGNNHNMNYNNNSSDDDDDDDKNNSSDDEDEDEIWDDTRDLLSEISKNEVLPPLKVLEILSSNDNIPLFVIKDFISGMLKESYNEVDRYQSEIDHLRLSTNDMRSEVSQLKSSARVFQATKCNSCQNNLELPAVHFLCMHSFHQHCLIDNENECNECAPENRKYEGIRKAQEEKATDHEQFFSNMDVSNDGFEQVANYFGKGIIR